jgi:hypothetical protein
VYPVSSTFLAALRQAHTMCARVDVYQAGVLVYTGLPFTDGSVQVSAGTGVRRTLTLTVPDSSLWDTLAPIGTELRAYRGITYVGVAPSEMVPLGVFGVDSQSLALSPSGAITITAPDRWARVQRARFETPAASVKGAAIRDEITRLVTGAIPTATVTNTASSGAAIGALVWDRDRDQAINDMCTSIGAEAYFDWTGAVVIRDAPLLSAPAITWRVDASPTGVLIGGDKTRSRATTYNVVVVHPAAVDGTAAFAPQTIADTDATSPTYVGGTMGRVPYFYSSPLVTTTGQAIAAGTTLLNKVKGLAAQVNVEAVVNPALDRGDVFYVLMPGGVVERHLAESFQVPLTPAGTQQITTRSSRPEGDVPATE